MRYAFLLLFFCLQSLLCAQTDLSDEVVKNIQARIDNGYSPSIAIGVIDADGPRYYTFGTATIGGEAVDEHTIYEIGSISKTFTGILLAQMVKEGKMELDDPVKKYLPESVTMPMWGEQYITLGHLSDHTSSLTRLPDNMEPADRANPYADYTVEQMYHFLKNHQLRREIGSEYEYSNLAQGLLGHVLARSAAKSYEELMLEKIAKPLGLQETTITLNPSQREQLAPGHRMGRPVSNWDIPTLAGAGAIRSSLHDMLLYLSANLGLQKSDLYPAMQLSHQARHDKAGNNRVGLGWHITEGSEGDVIWHNGGTGGYRTFAGFVNESGKGVVVLTNSTKGADDIGFHLLNPGAELIEVKKSLAVTVKNAIEAEGAEDAWPTYMRIKKTDLKSYDLNENEINNLGYYYLESGNTPAAVAVFKINTDAFPESSNVYDSYGEALMKDGQNEAAIKNYQQSLKLNPANSNAVDMLAKMGAKPELEEVTVDKATLQTYVGTYQLQPGFNIVISREGPQLFGQATGQEKFALYAKSETEFYLKVVNAQVQFMVKDGKVESLTLFQGGQELNGKKVK
ncbi:serine hydrolase [Flavilitoribacter nigricans]|uniref:Beta-lactamase n=1 Tax=Flavilitoribacter nigricans (strain ATCC 23147 / DSM 23189 / NBRC 102662 / NCIMB 1420 / SS-2) TaxID=1122177 RepID=A0A2D0N7B0_FLAN2|nr:serine hydrolase [Flavilitoribacter nigricans]PHN03653.1 hypothetical protein CRP01_25725 [Flavilitoribacter nigricans DSM 23189 = NBRC 102662]